MVMPTAIRPAPFLLRRAINLYHPPPLLRGPCLGSVPPASWPPKARLVGRPIISKRHLQTQVFWLPPLMFVGLLGALWVWKCTMMVLFQNKIIYMPGIPPNARYERIADYAPQCGGVAWEERRIRAADGTDLALCVASVEATGARPTTSTSLAGTRIGGGGGDELRGKGGGGGGGHDAATPVYIVYFQGNASSLPPRLQDLSWVLKDLQRRKPRARYTMVCLSYRGYWTSRGRASEKGINLDARAALEYVARLHREERGDGDPDPVLVLWGQSIGSGVATNLAAWDGWPSSVKLDAMVLETVFTSVKDMLGAMYPPKWVPYRYLWPFLWNHLDSLANLDKIAVARKPRDKTEGPRMTIVEAGRDEIVPAEHGAQLLRRGLELGLSIDKKTVQGAFHNDVMIRGDGRRAIADAVEKAAYEAQVRQQASYRVPG